MDPRRKLDEKHRRAEQSVIPFVEKYTEVVSVPQSLGPPVSHEIIVVRIHKSSLRMYALGLGILTLTLVAALVDGLYF